MNNEVILLVGAIFTCGFVLGMGYLVFPLCKYHKRLVNAEEREDNQRKTACGLRTDLRFVNNELVKVKNILAEKENKVKDLNDRLVCETLLNVK